MMSTALPVPALSVRGTALIQRQAQAVLEGEYLAHEQGPPRDAGQHRPRRAERPPVWFEVSAQVELYLETGLPSSIERQGLHIDLYA